jgi:Ca-activated chloride channel family protein
MLPRRPPLFAIALLAATLCAGAAQAVTPLVPLITSSVSGAPIQLQQLAISAELSGGMASTTVRMVFFNPNARQLEGKLQFPLLAGQQISAFSLDIGGVLRPAVPVAKAQGRAVFEAIERRQVDPGLLEVTQGNNFKLRIYPIAARGTRTVELRYTEALARKDGQWAYRLPLGYGAVQDFSLRLKVNGSEAAPHLAANLAGLRFERSDDGYAAQFSHQQFTPDGVIEIGVAARSGPQVYQQARQGAQFFVAEIPLPSRRVARATPHVLGLLWDSSGSGAARDVNAELAVLDTYFRALGKVEVRLVRLRDRAEAPQLFKVTGGDWRALRAALESTVYDGASALNDWMPQADVDQYLLVSDGLANYGGEHFPTLAKGQRLSAINSAVSADNARLAALAERSGGVLVTPTAAYAHAAAQQLLYQDASIDSISATGATDLEVESRTVRNGLLRVAGRLLAPTGQLTLGVVNGGKAERIVVPLAAKAPYHPLAASLWASFRLRALDADFDAHRAEIGRIGRDFGVTTRETSLIVLERADDYVRYDIAPPEALAAEVNRLLQSGVSVRALASSKHMDTVVRTFERRTAWWNTSYPLLEKEPRTAGAAQDKEALSSQRTRMPAPPAPSAEAPAFKSAAPAAPSPQAYSDAVTVSVTGSSVARSTDTGRLLRYAESDTASRTGPPPAPAQVGIALKKWSANAPYIERLRNAPADRVYGIYLDEKPGYANSSAFFLDVADILFDKGQRDLGLRVLSNLAEMDLENRALLRILGCRLLQANAPEVALPVFEKVLRLAEEEPQSFRDLGLAHAAAGHRQQAVDRLYEVVTRVWDSRFPEIENIVLAEINAIIAAPGTPVDTSRIDPRLLANLPLDLRVVLTWDADNSDMDLWVTDPTGAMCNYAQPLTALGGRMSRDFTRGYGPEEFSVRHAAVGKYRIQANYYGNRQQVLAGATTLQVKLFSGFGTPQQKEQVVTLRLQDRSETVFVGEFDVKP